MTEEFRVYNEFLANPLPVKSMLDQSKLTVGTDKGDDSVTYQNIVPVKDKKDLIEVSIVSGLEHIHGRGVSINHCFARYTFEGEQPPHFAHSDYEWGEYTVLIYLNFKQPGYGTHFLENIEFGFNSHPESIRDLAILKKDSNKLDKWASNNFVNGDFNKALIFNTLYLHGASPGFGNCQENGRCVLIAFYDLD